MREPTNDELQRFLDGVGLWVLDDHRESVYAAIIALIDEGYFELPEWAADEPSEEQGGETEV